MKALILAAGYATRLYPITKDYPKALLTIKKRPIIDYIIDKLEPIEAVDEIIVATNSKFISRFMTWQRRQHSLKRITLVDDLTRDNAGRLGAVGDMDFAIKKKRIVQDLLVIGGDNLFDCDLEDFLSFAKNNRRDPIIGAYNIKDKTTAKKYGVIKLNKQNRVIDFQEKPRRPKSTLVAMCLYYFPRESLRFTQEYLNERRGKVDATGSYVDWLRKKVPVYAFVFNGSWYDIGEHKHYNEAKETFAKKARRRMYASA